MPSAISMALLGTGLGTGRKSIEPMAMIFGGSSPDRPEIEQSNVLAWQRFITQFALGGSGRAARDPSRV